MTEEMWQNSARPIDLLGFLRVGRGRALLRNTMDKEGVLRKQRLFLTACCHRIQDLLSDERCRQAMTVVERQADQAALPSEIAHAQLETASVYKALRSRSAASQYTAVCAVMEMTRLAERKSFSHCIYAADLVVSARLSSYRELQQSVSGTANPDEIIRIQEEQSQATCLRDLFGNPFHPKGVEASWRTATVLALAGQMYESRDFGPMPILADALEDTGCDDAEILNHCRGPGPHVRGCWVLDLILGKN